MAYTVLLYELFVIIVKRTINNTKWSQSFECTWESGGSISKTNPLKLIKILRPLTTSEKKEDVRKHIVSMFFVTANLMYLIACSQKYKNDINLVQHLWIFPEINSTHVKMIQYLKMLIRHSNNWWHILFWSGRLFT